MAEDIASLKIKVDTSQVKSSVGDFDRLNAASRRVGTQTQDQTAKFNSLRRELVNVNRLMRQGISLDEAKRASALASAGATNKQIDSIIRLERQQKVLASSSRSLASSFISLRGTLATLGLGVTVGQIFRTADSYTKLTSQLKLATKSQQEFNEAYQNVQRIAATAQSDIEQTGVLYSRLSTALGNLGASQKQVSEVTEAVALGLKISGANAEETSAVMLQLSQAFGAGALTGDEFRSVNENAPRIMQALAESLGVTRGELKQMSADGKITSDIIGNALIKSLEKFRKEAEATRTISGGITGIKNEFTLLLGEMDKSVGASTRLASALKFVAETIRDLRTGNAGFFTQLFAGAPGLMLRLNKFGQESASAQSQSGKIRKAGDTGLLQAPQARFGIKEFLASEDFDTRADKVKKKLEELQAAFNLATKGIDKNSKDYQLALKRYTSARNEILSSKSSSSKADDTTRFAEQIADLKQVNALLMQGVDFEEAAFIVSQRRAGATDAQVVALLNLKNAQEDITNKLKIAKDDEKEIYEERRKNIESLALAQKEEIIRLNELGNTIKDQIDPVRVFNRQFEDLNTLLDTGRITIGEYGKAVSDQMDEMFGKTRTVTEEITGFWEEAAKNMQDAMSSFFFDIMQGNLSNLDDNFKRTIDQMVSNMLAAKAATALFGDFGGSSGGELGGFVGKAVEFVGGLFNASGNAFDKLGVMPFASGGVVNSPTPFNFGGGKLGVMGEAGPEAILPLKRGANGQLGVQTSGNSTVVNMTITTPDANSFRQSRGEIIGSLQRQLALGIRNN